MQSARRESANEEIEEFRLILDAIRHIVQTMRTFSSTSEAEVGLSAAQLFALQVIGRHAPLTVNDLAQATFTHQSSVSVVVRRLAEKGLVIKRPSKSDRRQVELSPTRTARALLRRAPAVAQDQLITALESLSDVDRRRLGALLGLVVDRLDSSGRAPPMFFEAGSDSSSED